MSRGRRVVYLYKVAHFRGNNKDVGGERHLAETLEPLIIHIYLVRRRIQWVVTGHENMDTITNNT